MRYFIILLSLLFINGSAVAQKFNTEAIATFWQVVDHLKTDRPLTDSLWDAYYNLYGNKKYMENNRSPEQALEHRKYLEYVFRPSFSDSLLKISPTKTTAADDILKNLLYIKLHEAQLRLYIKEITTPGYLQLCIELAKKWLPANKYNALPKDLVIYINAITLDAAVQPPDMYFGISLVYEFDRFQKGTIAAHELHHALRINREIQKRVSPADSASFSIVNQVNNEGCADLVDKTIAMQNEATVYEGHELMQWLMDSAVTTIKKLDSCFIVNATATDTLFVTRKTFRKITGYSSGHIPGFYMSNIIRRNGYEHELVNNNSNPFNIFFLYNKAAAKDSAKPIAFSNKTIAYLKQLESRVY